MDEKDEDKTSSPKVEFFGSLQSPYCYFALDRIETLMSDLEVRVVMRPVLPGVIRIPDSFADRSQMELAYFGKDVVRTATFLNLPYDEADPSPVNWIEGVGWIAGPDQERISYLYNLLYQAHLLSKEYPLYAAFMRLIWSGQVPNWDKKPHLSECLTSCGLPANLIEQSNILLSEADLYFAANQQAMFENGHWGVPMFSFSGEPFYGQDRLDQLRWRIENS